MKMRGWIGVLVLLLAGWAQAVNTTVPWSDKSRGQSQQGLIGYVESSNRNVAGAPESNLEPSGSNEGLLGPMLESEANLPAVPGSDPGASPSPAGGVVGQPAGGLAGGGNNVANRVNDPYWSLNPKNDPGTDFLDASSRVHLPAFAEIEWVATPLPTARKTSIMEFVVFPALGMLVLILLVTLLVLRIRRQRPLDRDRQLLHV